MGGPLKVTTTAAVIALQAIGCFASDAPTPVPTATPDIGAMVRAAIAALDGTATPAPIPTAVPTLRPTKTPIIATQVPTPTPIPKILPTADCSSCVIDTEPLVSLLTWDNPPRIDANGILTFSVSAPPTTVIYNADLDVHGNITVSDDGWSNDRLLGQILPPQEPGYIYYDDQYDFRASHYYYELDRLSVTVQLPLAAIYHPGLEICIWTDTENIDDSDLLGCQRVMQP